MRPGEEWHPDEGEDLEEEEDVRQDVSRSRWSIVAEVGGGLVALFLVSVAVIAMYLAGGVFVGLLTTAAPAVATMLAAVLLARYLSRR